MRPRLQGKASGARPALLVYGVALLVYLATLSRNSAASHDSINYINTIDAGGWVFHPHHLLYQPISVLWLHLWRAVGLSADSSLIVASLNAFFGAGIVTCVFVLLKRFFSHTTLSALSTTALVGCSFGVWFYSVCVEVYVIPLFLLLVGLFWLLQRSPSAGQMFLLGTIHGLATLFHQAYALVGVAVLARLYLTAWNRPPSKGRALLAYLAPAAFLVIGTYGAVLIWAEGARSIKQATWWLTSYAHELPQSWNPPGLTGLIRAFVGFSHSFVGGHFLLAVGSIQERLASMLGGHELRDELYLVRRLPSTAAIALGVVTAVGASLCLGVVVACAGSLKRIFAAERDRLVPILAWLVAFSLFFLIWEPSNLEFWIPQSVLIWLLLDRLWAFWAPVKAGLVAVCRAVLPACLLVANLFGSVIFLRSETNDYFYVRSQALAARVSPRDVVITHESWITPEYLRRFVRASILSPGDFARAENANRSTTVDVAQQLRGTLVSGGAIYRSFSEDGKDLPVQVQERFRAVWAEATAGLPLSVEEAQVGDDRYWVSRRR